MGRRNFGTAWDFVRKLYVNQLNAYSSKCWRLPSARTETNQPFGFWTLTFLVVLSVGTACSAAGSRAASNSKHEQSIQSAACQTNEALQQELAEIRADRVALQAELDLASGKIAKRLEELLASRTWKSDPEVVVLRGKLDAASREIEHLTVAASDSKLDLTVAKRKLQVEVLKLATLVKERDSALSEVAKFKNTLAAARQKISQLQKVEEVKLAKSELARKIAAQKFADLTKDSKERAAAADQKLQAATSKFAALVKERDGVFSEVAKLKSSLAIARQETNQLHKSEQSKLAKSELARNAAEQKLTKVHAAQISLSEELRNIKNVAQAATAQAVARGKDHQKAKEKIAALQAKLGILEASAAKLDDLRGHLKKAQLNVEKLEAKLGELRSERNALRTQFQKAQNDIANRIQKVFAVASDKTNTAVTDLRTTLESRDKEISNLKAMIENGGLERDKLRKHIAFLEEKAERLRTSLSKSKASKDKAEKQLVQERDSQQGLRKALETADENAKKAASETTVFRKKIERSNQRTEGLTAQREALKVEIGDLNRKHQDTQRRLEQMNDQVKASLARSTKLELQLQTALERADIAEKTRTLEAKDHAKEVSTLREKLATTRQALDDVKPKLADAQTKLKRARNDIPKRIENMIAAAMATPGTETADLKKELDAAREEIAKLNAVLRKQPNAPNSQQSTQ